MPFDLSLTFYKAKTGDQESIRALTDYFMHRVDIQLKNLKLSEEEYYQKYNDCLTIMLSNVSVFFEPNKFVETTLQRFKEIIYMNKKTTGFKSSDVVMESYSYVKARILGNELENLNVPIIYKECARLYYINGITSQKLSVIYKCSETVIYKRLRTVANLVLALEYSSIEKER